MPGVVKVNVYVWPLPVRVVLLVKVGATSECTLCGVAPVLLQVQVTVVPAETVSTAGFWVLLCPLLKKMFPTVTVPAAPLPSVGAVLLEHATAVAAGEQQQQVERGPHEKSSL